MNKILLGFIFAALTSTISMADDAAQIKKGKVAYQKSCATCHGEKLDGKGEAGMYLTPPPRDLVSDKFKNGDGAEQIFKTITEGLKGTTMAAFGSLPAGDRKAIAAYIVSIRKK